MYVCEDGLGLGPVNTSQPISDEHEADEAEEHQIELLEAREDAAVALEAPEQALNFVTALVHLAVVLPRVDAGLQWRHNRNEAEVKRELPGLVALVGTIHKQMKWPVRCAQATE